MDWLLILILILFFVWGGGFWASPAPYRGNSRWHVVLVIVVILLVLELFGGGRAIPHEHWRRFGR